MAKALQFQLADRLYAAEPVKLERKKLYGYKETTAVDSEGRDCLQYQLDPSGTLLIPPGAVKSAALDADGNSLERSEMILLDADGNIPADHPSAFDAPLRLQTTVGDEEFLDHLWKAVYQIADPDLARAVGDDIYAFPFSYRGGPNCDDGFLLATDDRCFLFAGQKADFPYLRAPDAGELDDSAPEFAEDNLEFEMM